MKGGFVVYSGEKRHLTRYFSKVGFTVGRLENPADFLIDVVSGMVNCEKDASFTTEDLPQIWIDNSHLLGGSSDASGSIGGDSERSGKRKEDYVMDWQSVKRLESELPSLQKELLANQELNAGSRRYSSDLEELKGLVIQICSACCHLGIFDTVDECARHVAEKIFSSFSPEQEREDLIDEALSRSGAPSKSFASSVLSYFSSRRNLMGSTRSVGSTDRSSAVGSVRPSRAYMCRTAACRSTRVFSILLTKDTLSWVRSLSMKTIDIMVTAIFAVILGFNQGAGQKSFQDILYMSMLSSLYMGMLSVVWAISLTQQRLNTAKREAGGSISTGLIYLSAELSSLADHVLRPTVYSILYYYIALPRTTFGDFYCVVLGVALSCSGLGTLVAVTFPENLATIAGLIIAFALGGLLNGFSPPLTDLPSPWIVFPSYARWGIEALAVKEFAEYNDWRTLMGMNWVGYSYDNWMWGVVFLYCSALFFRCVAYPFFRRSIL